MAQHTAHLNLGDISQLQSASKPGKKCETVTEHQKGLKYIQSELHKKKAISTQKIIHRHYNIHQFQNERRGSREARGRSTTVTVRSTVLGTGVSSITTSTAVVGALPRLTLGDLTNSSGAGFAATRVGAG
jgi:hypothetical protein